MYAVDQEVEQWLAWCTLNQKSLTNPPCESDMFLRLSSEEFGSFLKFRDAIRLLLTPTDLHIFYLPKCDLLLYWAHMKGKVFQEEVKFGKTFLRIHVKELGRWAHEKHNDLVDGKHLF